MTWLGRFWNLIHEPPLRQDSQRVVHGAVRRIFVQYFFRPNLRSMLLIGLLGGACGGVVIYFYNWTGRFIADEIVQVQLLAKDTPPATQLDPTLPGENRLFALDQPHEGRALGERQASKPGRSVSEKLRLLVGLAVLIVLVNVLDSSGVLWVLSRLIAAEQKMRFRLRRVLYEKLHRLPMSYHDGHSPGYLMTHLFSDVRTISEMMSSMCRGLQINSLMIVVGIVILLSLNVTLACIVMLAIPAYVVCYRWFRSRLKVVNENLREREGWLNAHIANRVRNFFLVKSFVRETGEGIAFLRQTRPVMRDNVAASILNTGFVVTCGVVTGVCVTAVLWLGALRVRDGQMTLGELLMFYGSTGAMFSPAAQLTQISGQIHRLRAACSKVVRVLDEPITLTDPELPVSVPGLAPEIRFDHVSLQYQPARPPALADVTFTVPAGKTLCVMGPSGCGKTSLAKLACRLYDVTEGSVRFDDTDVRQFEMAKLCRLVGFVNQEPLIFDGTIGENIRYGSEGAGTQAIVAAAKYAQIHNFIQELPKQYRTSTQERGLSLSGGQKQRVNLARALLYDPKVLVLDDCTSALDAETEARLVGSFGEALQGRTTIIVSHRMSIARGCDLVLMLDSGRVVEFGPPADLLQADGPFAAMQREQYEGMRLVNEAVPA